MSTLALESGSSTNDSLYTKFENKINAFNARRHAIAGRMIALLEGTEFHGKSIRNDQAKDLIEQAKDLLGAIHLSMAHAIKRRRSSERIKWSCRPAAARIWR